MPTPHRPRAAIAILVVSHAMILLAGFVAPYDPAAQDRVLPFAPPTRVHFVDARGKLRRPFVYCLRAGADGSYREDANRAYPVRFLVSETPYALRGEPLWRRHLFGTDEPAKIFLIGTDAYGRDLLSRWLYGGQISLVAGLLATLISLALGTALGGSAGFFGGWLDDLIMRAAEVFLALPWLYLLFAVRAFLPLGIAPNGIFLLLLTIIGMVGWARPARLIRGVVMSAKERDYVLAARGFGASAGYLLWRHIWPETANVAFTQAAVLVPAYVLAEVVLSFFGLGVSEPAASWGTLLASLKQYDVLESYWWMFLPALALIPIFLAYYRFFSYYGYCFAQGTAVSEIKTTSMSFHRP